MVALGNRICLIMALVLVSIAALSEFSYAAEKPTEVSVSAYVLNLGKFDVSTGSYVIDFYLSFHCDTECESDKFEFMNGRAISTDKIVDFPDEKIYRIQASLSQNIDLKQYPFDRHSLAIIMEDKDKPTDRLVYKSDDKNNGIDPSVVVVGWQLDGWRANVTDHYYRNYDETYSRFEFGVDISRVILASFLKSFLPMFFMVFVGLLSLLIAADKITTRLSLNISTLLASVMFHVNLTSSIPPVGYLTFSDKFMLVTYAILIIMLLSGIILMRHADKKDHGEAERVYNFSLKFIPVIAIVAYLVLFLVFTR